jgi:hypothetical protein
MDNDWNGIKFVYYILYDSFYIRWTDNLVLFLVHFWVQDNYDYLDGQ